METLTMSPSQAGAASGVCLEIPRDKGWGRMIVYPLGYGLRLGILDYDLKAPLHLSYTQLISRRGFGFCLSGRMKSDAPCFRQSFDIRPGQSTVYDFNKVEGLTETFAPGRIQRVILMLDPPARDRPFPGNDTRMAWVLDRLPGNASRTIDTITPAMRRILNQILSCPFQGTAGAFFLEGKVLELMAHKLYQLDIAPGESGVSRDDRERLHHAADFLVRDLENPPDMAGLARAAGMCRSKLHVCFPKVFGTSPFDYLRRHRLETAFDLILHRRMSVTEAACTVGYASMSHFTKAFKEMWGCLPGELRQQSGEKQTTPLIKQT
ncbi:MAG: AraC family transcriptional regulator [Bacteroidales bacterium]|jgi:AraC-like DNA-binding protein|nr:AraC family transcriptional regulator [Bacteroidales bacterium]